MRSITSLCFSALAASSAVQAQAAYAQQTDDADLLSDINVISHYWGALHNSAYIICKTTNLQPLKARSHPTRTTKRTYLV
jgi:hypothetical protein